MRHADERPGHVRPEVRRVAAAGSAKCLARLRGRHARPGELPVSVVVDLRVLDTEAGALGEAMLVGDADICNAEVEAAFDGPAGVGFSDRREVLMPIHRDAHAGSAAHTRPLDAGREHLWSRVHRLHGTGGVREADGLELRYLPHE